MSDTIYLPYTYLIGWSKLNKYYYGVRYSHKANPKDLWVIYFTSSKFVKQFVSVYGDPDIIQIRKTFISRDAAIAWEARAINKLKADLREDFLNRNNPLNGFMPNNSKEHNPFFGKTHTIESRQKMSKARKGIPHSKEHNLAVSKSKSGIPRYNMRKENHPLYKSDEQSKRANRLNNMILTCPCCNYIGKNLGNMKRWHFDKCKHKI
jgi:hypothetical protein